MPSDLIDQETFAERSERLRSSLIAAQHEYDSAVFKAETGRGAEEDVKNARQNIQAVRDRVDALGRAREVSKVAEAEAEQKQYAADRHEAIAAVHSKRDEVQAAADDIQSKVEALLGSITSYNARQSEFDSFLLPLIGESRERTVRDMRSRRHEGTLIVGLMQAAEVPGLSGLDEMSPTEAMRAFGGQDLAELVRDQLKRVLAIATPDLTEEVENEQC
jgi:hypothetical protein